MKIEQICPVRRRRRCGASKREREQKKKSNLLFTKSLERVETIGGGRETAHTFRLFSIEFLSGTGRPFAARGLRDASNYPYFLLFPPRPRTARHRSGVNTLTVASQFSIVFFFFSTTIFDIFTRLLNTVPSIHH